MRNGLVIVGILVLVLAVAAGSLTATYNRLVAQSEEINGMWAQVENQMQRRYDLIPNLVATVKGYAAHEEKVINDVVEARAKLAGGGLAPEQRVEAAAQLESALSRLLVVVEQYPNLKADAQFSQLMHELGGTENRLSVERMRYNEAVKLYNQAIKRFPTVFVANMLGFREKPYFEIDDSARTAPRVSF